MISPRLAAWIASGIPSIDVIGMSFGVSPRFLIACNAPSAISSFCAITPLICFGCAFSQSSIRFIASARDQFAVFFSITLMPGYFASTSISPFSRSICADWPIGPWMITTLPLPPIRLASASACRRPPSTSSLPMYGTFGVASIVFDATSGVSEAPARAATPIPAFVSIGTNKMPLYCCVSIVSIWLFCVSAS
ncbi:Uncharacterised protein [Burkholderia pseudomallei]|nr:Uncharacterised protein [Burkholderia pseudomallei]